MAHLIDKDALVAEIESERKFYLDKEEYDFGWNNALDKILLFIDTLEVKEVDLEDDVDKILESNDWNFDKIDFYQFAKHFLSLFNDDSYSKAMAEDKHTKEVFGYYCHGPRYSRMPRNGEDMRAFIFT